MTCSHIRRGSGPAALTGAAVVALCLGPLGTASGQSAVQTAPNSSRAVEANGGRMLDLIRALTAPGMDGRATGTPGNAKARAWILDRFGAHAA